MSAILGERRRASRDCPSFVGKKASRAWISAQHGYTPAEATYSYRVSCKVVLTRVRYSSICSFRSDIVPVFTSTDAAYVRPPRVV
jgi:hypothetical protein